MQPPIRLQQSSTTRWAHAPRIATVIGGKYRVEGLLGEGGMGVVIAATHLLLKQPVAIKILLSEAAREPANRERFKREARAAAHIQSDHVVRVDDIGALDDGTPYMVMEHLEGESLETRLARGSMEAQRASQIALQIAEALIEAHRIGIIHRDLKPANVFLPERADGSLHIKVLDFGIAKLIDEEDLTKTSVLLGSPMYMSPEQMTSPRDVDARSDIWSLGVLMFEMISGVRPFDGEALPEVCSKVLNANPAPLASLTPGLPPSLIDVVMRCLARDPAERYQSMSELASALRSLPTVSPATLPTVSPAIEPHGHDTTIPTTLASAELVATTMLASVPPFALTAEADQLTQDWQPELPPVSSSPRPNRRRRLPRAIAASIFSLALLLLIVASVQRLGRSAGTSAKSTAKPGAAAAATSPKTAAPNSAASTAAAPNESSPAARPHAKTRAKAARPRPKTKSASRPKARAAHNSKPAVRKSAPRKPAASTPRRMPVPQVIPSLPWRLPTALPRPPLPRGPKPHWGDDLFKKRR